MPDLLELARQYVKAGLSVIPIRADGSKQPDTFLVPTWKQYQDSPPDDETLARWFNGKRPLGIAIIGGAVSGNLEILDIDDASLFEEFCDRLNDLCPRLSEELPHVETPKGHHFFFRSLTGPTPGNQKLASRPREEGDAEHVQAVVLIETRGEGGYVLAPGSPPACHPLARQYVHVSGGPLTTIPRITSLEREAIIRTARLFNRVADSSRMETGEHRSPHKSGRKRPGDAFMQRASWSDILVPHGWELDSGESECGRWRRPGKADRGISATTGYCKTDDGDPLLYVFSSNAAPLEPNRTFTKFSAFGILNHAGDFQAAAQELYRSGYGDRLSGRPPSVGGMPDDGDGREEYEVEIDKIITELIAKHPTDKAALLQDILETPDIFDAFVAVCAWKARLYAIARTKLEAHGLSIKQLDVLEKAIKGTINEKPQAQLPGAAPSVPVAECLERAPVPEGVMVPAPWALSEHGLFKEKVTRSGEVFRERISPTPVIITGRLKDRATGQESVRLSWLKVGRWHSHTVERSVLKSGRLIVQVSDWGLEVHQNNSKQIIQWLSDFEAENVQTLPRAFTSTNAGWQVGDSFIIGDLEITGAGDTTLKADKPETWGEDSIIFCGEAEGQDQLMSAFHTLGSFDQWKRAVASIAQFERAVFAVYASLASCMLRVLNCGGFTIDWSNPTSSGKTTALQLAASVWGNPVVDRGGDAARTIYSWNQTRTWIEGTLAALMGIPLFLDDTKQVGDVKDLVRTVYDLANQRGRGRGQLTGTQRTRSWCTLILSTGEQRLTTHAVDDGGAHGRALCIWGSPFGETDESTAVIVRDLRESLCDNYGHAGPAFVRWIMGNKGRWEEWRTLQSDSRQGYAAAYRDFVGANPSGQNVVDRLSGYLAVIDLTACLAHEALELPWDKPDFWQTMRRPIYESVQSADPATAALLLMVEHANMSSGNYRDLGGRINQEQPPQGWAGRFDVSDRHYEFIAYGTQTLQRVLESHGFSVRAVTDAWRDRGWLQTGPNNRKTKSLSLGGSERPALYIVKRQAIIDATGDDPVGQLDLPASEPTPPPPETTPPMFPNADRPPRDPP